MRAKACISCRQLKIKCNYRDGKCEHCVNTGKTCVYDPRYRRLKKPKTLGEGLPEHVGTGQVLEPGPELSLVQNAQVDLIHCVTSKSIADITLTPDIINELFDEFIKHYHVFMPFILSGDIENMELTCPLLFWTICKIANRDALLNDRLNYQVRRLVQTAIITAVRDIQVIQALILLSMWPLPFNSQLENISNILATLVLQYSMQIGLHRPSLKHEFSHRSVVAAVSADIRLTTWQACFIIHNDMSSRLGIPQFLEMDFTLRSSLRDNSALSQQVSLTDFWARAEKILAFSANNLHGLQPPETRMVLVNDYCTQLRSMASVLDFNSLAVRARYIVINLKLLYFVLQEDMKIFPAELSSYSNKLYMDTESLIGCIDQSLRHCLPMEISRFTVTCGLMLLKSIGLEIGNISRARNLLVRIIDTINQLIDTQNEGHLLLKGRSLLRALSGLSDDLKTVPPVSSRGSASLLYDAIRITREHSTKLDQTLEEFLSEFGLDVSWLENNQLNP